jgi:hypothetical protein
MYGVTTVPGRRKDLLPKTLQSLAAGGFDKPRLFVDGDWDYGSWHEEFGLDLTMRYPRIRTYGNWVLCLAELYIRNPSANYYVIFQDDLICSMNMRQYLETIEYPNKGYWNLYTFPENQHLSHGRQGFYPSNRLGKGAVGLVFDSRAILILLAHDHMVRRARDPDRGHKYVDGGVVETMNQMGWIEHVHNPSLVQHTGHFSTSGNPRHALAPSFRGESYDLMQLAPSQG